MRTQHAFTYQTQFLKGWSRGGSHIASGHGASGEGNQAHQRMRRQGSTSRSPRAMNLRKNMIDEEHSLVTGNLWFADGRQ